MSQKSVRLTKVHTMKAMMPRKADRAAGCGFVLSYCIWFHDAIVGAGGQRS